MWYSYYSLGYNDEGYSVAPTPDGGLLVGGMVTYQPNGTDSDPFVYKLDSLGNEEWHQTLGTPIFDTWSKVRVLADGNYLVALSLGQGRVGTRTLYQPQLLKLTPQGQVLWQRWIGPARPSHVVMSVQELANGALVIAGGRNDAPLSTAKPEGFAVKVCADGDTLWSRHYKMLTGSQSHNYLCDFRPTPDGGFVGSGFLFAFPPDTGSSDGWAFRVDSAGYLQAGGAPVTGRCRPITTGSGEFIMKNEALRVWPNPSLDGYYSLSSLTPRPPLLKERGRLMVTDALGRVVWRGVWNGAAETVVDLSHCAPGVYVLRGQTADGRVVRKKLVR